MNTETLNELANKWRKMAEEPKDRPDYSDDESGHYAKGWDHSKRKALEDCANDIYGLIAILG